MGGRTPRSPATSWGARLFVVYAAASLVPVVALGVVLVRSEQRSGTARGLAQGTAQADVIVQMVIAPALDRRNLSEGLTAAERERLQQATDLAIYSGSLTAIRLRSFGGDVVFADDGTDAAPLPSSDPAFVSAAAGRSDVSVVPGLTSGAGRVIRVLQPVVPNATGEATGVLELYLPYAPIAAVVRAEAHQTYLRMAEGLAVLYLVLAAISWSTTGRLRRYASRQAHQANHDPLTGLPNRAWFRDHAQAALDAVDRGQSGAIVLIDLNGFKEVNDTLGHHAGDKLLQCVAQRLSDSVRTDDGVARLGGDEFGLILPGITDHQTLMSLLTAIQVKLGSDVEIAGSTLSIEASFGVALYPEHSTDLSMLMIHADAAMYQGKRGIQRMVIWQPGSGASPTHRHELHSELQRALDGEELVLHYQPKIDLASGRVVGVEALIRWNHPHRGLLPPSEFIPAAEASTLINPLTRWVLRQALADQRAWHAQGASWTVAVNVSAHNLESPGFGADVLTLIDEAGARPADLVLELTETAFAEDNAATEAAVAALSAAGVSVSLDDFGTGSTGLLQLRSLTVREIKIDRVFVRELAHNPGDRNLVRAVVDLAHGLGCRVVAEGVEDPDSGDWLHSVGCDEAQGYLYQRPTTWPQLLTRFLNTASAPIAPTTADLAPLRDVGKVITP